MNDKKKKIRDLIKGEYGTMTAFCKAHNLDRYNLQKIMSRKDMSAEDEKFILGHFHTVPVNPSEMINPSDGVRIELLKEGMTQKYGGVDKFITNHPEFDRSTVFQILQGKRKRMTPIIQSLFDHFGIK